MHGILKKEKKEKNSNAHKNKKTFYNRNHSQTNCVVKLAIDEKQND